MTPSASDTHAARNQAVIYSNGIADFRRGYRIAGGSKQRISLPVKTGHVADVLASLNVYGAVSLVAPPSFRPANEHDGSLTIDPANVLTGLATRLSGAAVEVVRAGGPLVAGALVGLHAEAQGTSGEPIEAQHVVVLTEQGLKKVPLREVQHLRFVDESVRVEIEKALQRNFETIKPNSTFIELELAADDATEAVVQYTIPAAAWKVSYRLVGESTGKFQFRGFAVVDNNTDEDWNDFAISVVTGEPITFSTDLADAKIPQRKHVDVVRDVALGLVEVEEAVFADAHEAAPGMAMAGMAGEAPRMRRMSKAARAAPMQEMQAAELGDAAIEEVGDFCVYESKMPVSIAANRSAIIPVFDVELSDSRSVLHYKTENHAKRPFRSIEFKNETSHSLGRGVCTVYDGGIFAGSCILPATKPGDDALLPHALDTGVRVRREQTHHETRSIGMRFSKGFGYTSLREVMTTNYDVASSRVDVVPLVIDHDYSVHDPETSCELRRGDRRAEQTIDARLENGLRTRIALEPRDSFTLQIVETRVHESSVQLVWDGGINTGFLIDNFVHRTGPLSDDPGVRRCLELQQKMDEHNTGIQQLQEEISRLQTRQERLRQNIATGGHDEQTARWRTNLGESEDRIVDIEERQIPRLQAMAQEVEGELRSALLELTAEWSAPA